MYLRKFGSDKIRTYVHPFMQAGVKFLHFKHPARFGNKSHGHPDYKREKQQQQSRSSLSFD